MYRVTVIMPVYNAENYLREAIDSILHQTYRDFELLIIDDASTDSSTDIVEKYRDQRIRLVKNKENLGISGARNQGLMLSNTEFIALMDHDDIASPTRLEKEIEFLDKNPDVDVVGGHLREIDPYGNDKNRQWTVNLNPNYIKAYLLLGNNIANGTAMFRKSFIDKHNIRYLDHQYGVEDYRFWVECSLHGKIVNLDEAFLLWRTGHNHETGRVKQDKVKQRDEVFRQIQRYALEKTGFKLNEKEMEIIQKVFKIDGILQSNEEIIVLYSALKHIAIQAKDLKLDNAEEVIAMCRKRFGEKIGKAFYLWE